MFNFSKSIIFNPARSFIFKFLLSKSFNFFKTLNSLLQSLVVQVLATTSLGSPCHTSFPLMFPPM
jgi:hypothetical protein